MMKPQIVMTCILAIGVTQGIVNGAETKGGNAAFDSQPFHLVGLQGGFGRITHADKAKRGKNTSSKKKPKGSTTPNKKRSNRNAGSSKPQSDIKYRSIWDPVAY